MSSFFPGAKATGGSGPLPQDPSNPFPGARPTDGIDTTTGAPTGVRAAVSAAKSPEDKLATVQQFFPDAREHGEDNFVFTNPQTGELTAFNAEGLDIGDIVEWGRSISEMLGGAVGGAIALAGGQAGPQVATPEELVTIPAATGVGAAAGGQLWDTAVNSMYPVQDTRGALEQGLDVAQDIAVNTVGHRAGEMVSNKGGQIMGNLGKRVGDTARKVADSYRALKVSPPSAGAVSNRPFVKGIENALANTPFGGDTIRGKYAETLDALDRQIINLAETLSGGHTGTVPVGTTIKRGVEKFTRRFRETGNRLYNDLAEAIPDDTRVRAGNFKAELDSIGGQFSDDPAFAEILDSPAVKQFRKALEDGDEVSMKTLSSLRTKIGNKLDDTLLAGDASKAELRKMYGALTEDLREAAMENDAIHLFNRASQFWKAGRTRIDDILQPMVNGAVTDDIYKNVFNDETGTLKKQSLGRIRGLMKSLTLNEKKVVSSEFLRRMGQTTPGAAGEPTFSPGVFMTNYNKMTPEIRETIFGGDVDLARALENLRSVSNAMKETQALANPSGTARNMAFMDLIFGGGGAVLGGAEGAIGGIAAGHAMPAAVGKLWTSPRFINWLSKSGTDMARSPAAIGPAITRLLAIAQAEPEIEAEIHQYAGMLRNALPAGGAPAAPPQAAPGPQVPPAP